MLQKYFTCLKNVLQQHAIMLKQNVLFWTARTYKSDETIRLLNTMQQ